MKKFLKTTAKKSMALVMTVVMLMSCWVFVAPVTEAHAAQETFNYTLQELYDTYLTEASNAITVQPQFNGVGVGSGAYHNVLYSPNYTNGAYDGVVTAKYQDSSCESKNIDFDWHFADGTVLLYDGGTRPKTGIMLMVDPNGAGYTIYGSWSETSELTLSGQWKGYQSEQGTLDWNTVYINGDANQLNNAAADTSAKFSNREDSITFANTIYYSGTPGSSEYLITLNPNFGFYSSAATTKSSNTSATIRVINYKPVKDAINAARALVKKALDAKAGYYTQESVNQLITVANALVAAKPDSTFFDANNGVKKYNEYAADAKAAVDAYNAFGGLKVAEYTVTFVDAQGTVSSQTVNAGGAATEPAPRAKAYDSEYHYTFSGWDKSFDNVVENMTVTAQYTGTKHTHNGAYSYKDGTHAQKCSGCASVGYNGKDGVYVACDGTWGGTDATHTKPCSICGNTQTHTPNFVEVPEDRYQVPLGSDYNACEDNIYCYKSCSICGQAHSTDTFVRVAAKGEHVYDTYTGHTNNTCTEAGYDTWLCSSCGQATTKRYDTVNGQPGTDPAEHTWDNKLAIYSDTQHGYKCKIEGCGAWKTDSIADHSYKAPTGTAIQTRPTCYQDGWGTYKCDCGHTYEGSIPATGNHTWNTNKLVEIDENVHGYRCRQAGCPAYQIADDGSELHVWTKVKTITEPTCSADGRDSYKCDLCGATKEVVVPADPDAHAYGEIVYIDENTHGRVCANNPAHTVEVADHSYEAFEDATHDKLLPTCSAEGYHYEKCSVCGNIKKVTDAIVSDAHSFGEIEDLGDGTHGRVCANNATHTSEVESHDAYYEAFEDATHDKLLPTCSAEGYHYEKCSVCGNIKKVTDAIVADAHAYGEIVNLGDGTHGRVCANNATHTSEVESHDAYYEAFEDATHDKLLPTCSAEGYHYEKCSVCGNIKKVTDAIVSDAHSFGEIEDLGDGTHGRVCAYDASHKTDVDEHDYEKLVDADHPEVIPTCVATGSHYEKCTVCGNTKQVIDDIDPNNHLISAAASSGDGTHTAKCERPGCTETATQKCSDTDADKNCVCDICSYNIPHIYDKEVVTDEYLVAKATCTTKAVYNYSCQCGVKGDATFFEYGAPLGHDYTEESDEMRSHATCADAQTNWYGCTRCDANAKDDADAQDKYYIVGEPLGHAASTELIPTSANTHAYKCVRYGQDGCEAVFDETACVFGNYVDNGDGTHTGACACTNTLTEAHDLTKWATDGGSATDAPGKHSRYCTLCSYTENNVDCTDYEVTEHVDATCMEVGHTTYECKDCGHGYSVVHAIDSDNHTGNNHFEGGWAPTCNATGYEGDIICECGEKVGDGKIIAEDPANHGTNTERIEGFVEATCSVQGHTGNVICDGCNKIKIADMNIGYNKNNHKNITEYPELKPTCEEEGHTSYGVCDDCGTTIGQKIVLAATGHDYTGEGVNLEKGKHAYECKNGCGTIGVGKVKDATEDCYGGEATCLEPAYCSVCKAEYADPLGHDFSADNDRANQVEPGYHNYKCSRCDEYGIVEDGQQVIGGKLECYDATPVRTGATCTEYAYYTYTCDVCEHVWVITGTSEEDAPLGHDYTSQKFLDSAHRVSYATCTESAVYWYDCSRCTKNAKDEEDTEKYQNLTYAYGDPLGHKFDGKVMIDEAVLASPANCTQNARYYVYCTVCKASSQGTDKEATFEYYGSMGDHYYEDVVAEKYLKSEATCTAKAVYYKSCKGCGAASTKTFTTGETVPHAFTEKVMDAAHIVTKANCQTAATYWYDCANCVYNAKLADKTDMTDEEIAALTYTDGEVNANNHTNLTDIPVKNPTCDEEGHSAYKKCDGCNQEFGKTVYATTTHDFRGVVKTYDDDTHNFKCVNCEAYGNNGVKDAKVACSFGTWVQGKDDEGKAIHTKKCSCGNTKSGTCLDADPTVVAPSCTAEGYTSHKCDTCGNTWTTDVTEKTKHEIPEVWTPGNDGTHSRKCANCGEGETKYCSGGTATCKEKAVCVDCKAAYGELADHTEGEWKDDPARPATCYANKWQITACTVCQTALEKEIPGSAYPQHDMDTEWVVTVAPTCAAEGEQQKRCQHKWTISGVEYQCDYTETMIIPAEKDSHIWGEWEVVGGDCSTGIKEKRICTVCQTPETRTNNAVEHEMKPYVIVNPTCEADGYIKTECQICKYTTTITAKEDDSLKATGHNFQKNASATTSCVEVETCANCGKNKSTPIGIDVAGAHKWVVFAGSQPTCSSDGYTDYYHCTGCGAEKGYETIEKLGHYDNNGDGKCDDCKGEFFGEGDSTSVCGCICHKSNAFMQFIYKIVRFFWKLFGISKTCDCGATHY